MSDHDHSHHTGCSEYRDLSRRQFLASSTALSAAAIVFPEWLPKVTLSNHFSSTRDILVSVFMRGATDGLAMVIPHTEARYYAIRPTIRTPAPDSMAANRAIALDNRFAFPPAMRAMLAPYQAGDLLITHATGHINNNNRSHFDAQRFMEVGRPVDPDLTTGWLGRHLASVPPMHPSPVLRGIGISSGLAKTLVGAPQTLPIADPANYGIGGSATTRTARMAMLRSNYEGSANPLRAAALDAVGTIDLLARLNINAYAPAGGAVYPNTSFGRGLRSVAALIKADIGIEAASVDIGGWDTHAAQDPNAGQMATLMTGFAQAMTAFWIDVMNTGQRVTLVAVSEFGRNAIENGSQGTDHGRGTVMFAMGKGIAGGRVYTNGWPGLEAAQLEDRRDLRVTLDYRDVLAEIVQRRLENNNLGYIFPGWRPTFRGVTR
ncbi:DUF1501 domain-containing protein [Gemmatimonas sp.]|jgi:uncharacterized protein (DUF1501 family)|uniref:DUF1501 domain-containing protein n=1 Tax=Gemmatimonas sp. TaxID=1962908 RepID=UPI0025B9B527|nr:DUF1501 domain-containing protein [Gemmatimonas sp.]MCA2986026.1 DUF1501 domain-containing protein [Gemmatimonas sp.]MCA2989918.1 DUF1501 domain-containing protein [Gemmatimonas sp.]